MATQDYCPNFYGDTLTGNQHANLNLNQNYRHECKESFSSKNVTADSRKTTNYAVPKLSCFDNSRAKKDLNSWKKSNKSSHFLNLDCGIPGEKDKVKKEGKYSSIKNSTLSLHIASYEATNEPLNDENECLKKKNEKQQENENVSTPEIAQFKASQNLLNPNVSPSTSTTENVPSLK
uniref:Uncharacterized protein n=1 Tax=Panagrolaimus sp. ES5 TaxID=591445 RepID=A0AC34F3X8_9BILA